MYQTQISKLHPPSRGDGTNIDLKSNLDNFYDEPEPLTDAEYDVLDARGKYSISLAPLSRFRANDEADTVIFFSPSRRRSRRRLRSTSTHLLLQQSTSQDLRAGYDDTKAFRANGWKRQVEDCELEICRTDEWYLQPLLFSSPSFIHSYR